MDLATFIGGAFVLFVAAKWLPAMIEGWQQGRAEYEMRQAIKKNPQHAREIMKFMKPPSWTVQKKGGGAGKWIVIALCAIYIVSPLDFIPDVIPGLGWGDDVVAGLIALTTLLRK
jgi:uncharacterized membrane protein YkvA (DUF1232 family)